MASGSNIRIDNKYLAGTIDILAIKLELGDHQTLAHQEDGKWVLNEIPSYTEQLERCLRYQIVFQQSDRIGVFQQDQSNLFMFIPIPVPMRESVTIVGDLRVVYSESGSIKVAQITSPVIRSISKNIVLAQIVEAKVPVGTVGYVDTYYSQVIFDANL